MLSTDIQKILKHTFSNQRSPTLNTILMVEETLQKAKEPLSASKLRIILPKQVMHQTLMAVIDYLDYSGKIKWIDGKILWNFKTKLRKKK